MLIMNLILLSIFSYSYISSILASAETTTIQSLTNTSTLDSTLAPPLPSTVEKLVRLRRQPPYAIIKHYVRSIKPSTKQRRRIKRPKIKYGPPKYTYSAPINFYKPMTPPSKRPTYTMYDEIQNLKLDTSKLELPPSSYEAQTMDLDFYSGGGKQTKAPRIEYSFTSGSELPSYSSYDYKSHSNKGKSVTRAPHQKYGIPKDFEYSTNFKGLGNEHTISNSHSFEADKDFGSTGSEHLYDQPPDTSFEHVPSFDNSYHSQSTYDVPEISSNKYETPNVPPSIKQSYEPPSNNHGKFETYSNKLPNYSFESGKHNFAEPPPSPPKTEIEITYSPSYEINLPPSYSDNNYKEKPGDFAEPPPDKSSSIHPEPPPLYSPPTAPDHQPPAQAPPSAPGHHPHSAPENHIPSAPDHQSPSAPGHQPPSSTGYQPPSAPRRKPQSRHRHRRPPSSSRHKPPSGPDYQPPSGPGHQSPNSPMHYPPSSPGHQPPSGSGHHPPSAPAYQPPPMAGHQPPSGSGHHRPSAPAYQPPTSPGHQPPSGSGHHRPSAPAYQPPTSPGHQPPSGSGHHRPSMPAHQPPSGPGNQPPRSPAHQPPSGSGQHRPMLVHTYSGAYQPPSAPAHLPPSAPGHSSQSSKQHFPKYPLTAPPEHPRQQFTSESSHSQSFFDEDDVPSSQELPLTPHHKSPPYDFPKSSYEVPIYDPVPFDASNREQEFYPPQPFDDYSNESDEDNRTPSNTEQHKGVVTDNKIPSTDTSAEEFDVDTRPSSTSKRPKYTRANKVTRASSSSIPSTIPPRKHILDAPELEKAFEAGKRKTLKRHNVDDPDTNESNNMQNYIPTTMKSTISMENFFSNSWNPMRIRTSSRIVTPMVQQQPESTASIATTRVKQSTGGYRSDSYNNRIRQRQRDQTKNKEKTAYSPPGVVRTREAEDDSSLKHNIDILSIEKSQSHSYYDGTLAPPISPPKPTTYKNMPTTNKNMPTRFKMPTKLIIPSLPTKRTTKSIFDTTHFKSPILKNSDNDKDEISKLFGLGENLPKNHKLY